MKEKNMRKPRIENKYNLKPKDIQRAVVIDHNKLHQLPFWRNNVVQAWCLSGGSGKGFIKTGWIHIGLVSIIKMQRHMLVR